MIQALLLEATARDALGDAGAAGRTLELALDLAEADGILLPFLLFPAPELLERHARSRTAHAALPAEVRALLAGRTPDRRAEDVAPLAEPLSEAELRVLRYLPTNLRAPEIAGELFVSVNTVRTHMRHIYAKLGVHQRAGPSSVRARLGCSRRPRPCAEPFGPRESSKAATGHIVRLESPVPKRSLHAQRSRRWRSASVSGVRLWPVWPARLEAPPDRPGPPVRAVGSIVSAASRTAPSEPDSHQPAT